MTHASRPPPSPHSRFIGREADLLRLDEASATSALVSVVGAAGVGKTRLAHEWARAARTKGIATHVVDLSEARTTLDVVHAVMRALGRETLGGASEEAATFALEQALVETPGARLVLDDCEGCRAPVASVASVSTEARLVVTSRIRLGVEGERVVTLEPLPTETLARDLFVDRAGSLGVAIDPHAPELAQLVTELEGVPLAIELAAARTRVLSVTQLLERVRSSRLDVLRRALGPDDSLRARYEWSLELLTQAEADALSSLAVFARDFDVAAAEAIVGEPARPACLDVLQGLREHHVIRDVGASRYALYDGLRELASERAVPAARAAAEKRHAMWFAGRAVSLGASLRTQHARSALLELEGDEPELRIALERSTTHGDASTAADVFAGLAALRQRRGPTLDVAALGERVAAAVENDDAAAARVALARGYLIAEIDPRGARTLCEEAVARGDRSLATGAPSEDLVGTVMFARAQIAVLSTRLADHETATRVADALLADPRASAQELARAWYVKAIVASSDDDADERDLRRAMGAALDHAARSGDPSLDARTQLVVAMIEAKLGSGDAPISALDRARAACLDAGDRVAACIARMTRASALVETMPVDGAVAQLTGAIEEATELGMLTLQAHGLWQRALLRLSSGHVELAESDLAESAAGFAGAPMGSVCIAARACARAMIGEDVAARAMLATIDLTAGFDSTRVIADAARAMLGDPPASDPTIVTARGPRVAHVLAKKILAVPRERQRETLACGAEEFTVEGSLVTLTSKPRLLLLYRALVDAHRAQPSRFVSRQHLLEAVWPGERILARAATNRLNVALSSLRRLGLPLETEAGGVRLSPRVRVVPAPPRA